MSNSLMKNLSSWVLFTLLVLAVLIVTYKWLYIIYQMLYKAYELGEPLVAVIGVLFLTCGIGLWYMIIRCVIGISKDN